VKYSVKANPTESEILDWCMAYLAKTFKTPIDRILPHAKFARLGMDSAASVFFLLELEEWLGLELRTELVFEYPTPAELARYVAEHHRAASGARGPVG
jgi:acyl carrier protein